MTDNYYENANRSSNDRFNRHDERFHTPRPLGSAYSSRSGQASVASGTSRSTTRSHERFYTPRASAMSARSYGSTRSQMSGRSMATARSNISSSSGESSFRTSRTSTSFSSPSAYISNNRNRPVNPHTISHRRQTISSFDREMDLEAASTSIHHSSSPIHNNAAQQFTNNAARANNNNSSQDIFSLARHARVQEVEELLIRGVPITSTDENGNTILSIGCQNGSKRICKLALRFGADINQQNSSGNTPLHYCFLYQKDSLGRYLICKGADETIRNNDGRLYSEVGR